jgi:hypothetical protein
VRRLPAHPDKSLLCGGRRDPFICTDGEEMGPTPLPNAQQALVALAAVAMVSSSCLGECGPPLEKVYNQG